MSFLTTKDMWYAVLSACFVFITVFLVWALYEVARLIRQVNLIVNDTREKMGRLERAMMAIGEKLGNMSQYMGFLAEGAKQLMTYLHKRKEDAEEKKEEKE